MLEKLKKQMHAFEKKEEENKIERQFKMAIKKLKRIKLQMKLLKKKLLGKNFICRLISM